MESQPHCITFVLLLDEEKKNGRITKENKSRIDSITIAIRQKLKPVIKTGKRRWGLGSSGLWKQKQNTKCLNKNTNDPKYIYGRRRGGNRLNFALGGGLIKREQKKTKVSNKTEGELKAPFKSNVNDSVDSFIASQEFSRSDRRYNATKIDSLSEE